ncbi:FAD-dependent oxidoreductase [Pseudomonas oryzihabitans]|nr:FAD-dependent oxidoreductase [Pseudomonas oryzihabitans]NMZ63045.1 FAD-dependent oxidoreductase [Pseudomonas oryzihabitans]
MRDAIVIGGGFYGAMTALYLMRVRGFAKVTLVEREDGLLKRASYHNQARVHNGYHYPRSFVTAFRSRVNLPRFLRDYPDVVVRDFTKLYAIARNNSKVTAKQFERFCQGIEASLQPASEELSRLFDDRLIEAVYLTEEYAFNSAVLAAEVSRELDAVGVELRFKSRVTAIRGETGGLGVDVVDEAGGQEEMHCRYLFNCTYSGLNQYGGDFPGTATRLRHEITEMALVEMPPELRNLGVTVMDGPFFSMMPFPARGLHTLSHVRYTPHLNWEDANGTDPYALLDGYDRASRADWMVRDVARYMSAAARVEYRDSLFEVKTILMKNEGDDGRPILFEQHPQLPGCYSMLGGKIDNIFDALERLDAEPFH